MDSFGHFSFWSRLQDQISKSYQEDSSHKIHLAAPSKRIVNDMMAFGFLSQYYCGF